MTSNTSTNDTPRTVQQRFVAAMRDVASVGKGEQANMKRGGSFKFRGIDAVMNAVGPAFRTHGLFLMPELIDQQYERVPRGNGGMMISTVVTVCFHIMCEETGQEITGTCVGEANDTADKATAKAMSVALRTFLLQSMVLPTDEPDPDTYHNEHAQQPQQQVPAKIYADGNWDPEQATRQQLAVAIRQAQQDGENEVAANLMAVGKRRFAPAQQQATDNEGAES